MKAEIRSTTLGVVLTAVLLCSAVFPQNRIWCVSESGHSALETALDECEHAHFTHVSTHSDRSGAGGKPGGGMAPDHCEGNDCSDFLLRVAFLSVSNGGTLILHRPAVRSFGFPPMEEVSEGRIISPNPPPPSSPPSLAGVVLLI